MMLKEGVSFEVDRYVTELWKSDGVSFVPRIDAEQDPALKQLIPYVIMNHKETYLCYSRGRGVDEPRLAQKVSIGIGGHINRLDAMSLGLKNLQEVYLNAVVREVAEEVIVETDYEDEIVGLINDDSNEVGKVHFGIIHFWRLAEPKVRSQEDEICKLRFMNADELVKIRYKMETWSQLCLDSLDKFSKIAGT